MANYIRWLGGAGFLFRYNGLRIGLDVYLSNHCMNEDGSFKRLTPPPCAPETLEMDYLIASHEHGDHIDLGCLDLWFGENPDLKLIGTASALKDAAGIVPKERTILLRRGERLELAPDVIIESVFCDHGDQSPDAIGVILHLGTLTVYFTGDTCWREDIAAVTGVGKVDILLPPINPAYGNPGPDGAAKLAKVFTPKVVIPCHYFLFKEHGGDPAEFERSLAAIAPGVECRTLAIGEKMGI